MTLAEADGAAWLEIDFHDVRPLSKLCRARKRLHSSIGCLPPVGYEQAFQEAHKTASTDCAAAQQNWPEDS